MYHFCTYFDHRYLPRGLALYRSLRRHCSSFNLWVLCMDSITHKVLSRMALPNIRLISLDELEKDDEPLRTAKKDRSLIEYYFTCTPSLLLYILNSWSEVNMVTYLDADLFFFAPLEPIYEEMGSSSILIVGHRFPSGLRHLERYGIYNVGLLSFRRDEPALRCLHWWRERCLEWCYDRVENDRFADQKYLDDWPTRFSRVTILQHKGAGLAPWNIANYTLRLNAGHVAVDEQPLIFFHFHHLKQINKWIYDLGLVNYQAKLFGLVRHHIYIPYIRELREITSQVTSFSDKISIQSRSIRYQRTLLASDKKVLRQLARRAKSLLHFIKRLSQGDLLVVAGKKEGFPWRLWQKRY